MSRRALAVALAALLPLPLGAQQLVTFTHTQGGANNRPLGYPVPVPVESLDAVDGFRGYASLHARLQALALASDDLSAHEVGSTQGHGRTVWAYRVGDPDATDHEGGPEPAFFINAGIHAREWGTQEISTWLVERMMAGAGDGGLVRWLLDTTTLVIVPVHNVDGFLQTQRYPTQALVGADPRVPGDWPRDGRMRRKNMRGVDENLQTLGDHLGGIDLNRNHPPFWNTDVPNYSSANPADLVYHGSAPHSEAENLAIAQALLLAPPERLRMGVDIHSFTQVFYSSNTGNARLNAIQSNLLARVSAHHSVVGAAPGSLAGAHYPEVRDPPNRGGGLLAEYLAYEHAIPAWTLEIEPNGNLGGRQYGGTSEGHAGFILPASEVRRVREAWAESHLLAFYYMAGAPYLEAVRISDAASGATVLESRWQRSGATRQRSVTGTGALQPGRSYRAELVFSKPMRIPAANGSATVFPNQFLTGSPRITLSGPGQDLQFDPGLEGWQAQGRRWAFDRYEFGFEAPDTLGAWTLQVDVVDAVGHRLDANPATPVDWVAGAWSGLENAAGSAGDVGGADGNTHFSVQQQELLVRSVPTALGEGEVARIVLGRSGGDGALAARATVAAAQDPSPPGCPAGGATASWASGESGDRTVLLCTGDDLLAQGDRTMEIRIEASREGGGFEQVAVAQVQVLDNDAGGAVLRVPAGALGGALQALAASDEQPHVDLVLDAGEHLLAVGPGLACDHNRIGGPATVHGNHAVIRHQAGASDCTLLHAIGAQPVTLRDLTLSGRRAGDGAPSARVLSATPETPLVLSSVVLEGGLSGPGAGSMLLAPAAAVTLERTAFRDLPGSGEAAALLGGDFALRSSSLAALGASAYLALDSAGGTITGSSFRVTGAGQRAVLAGAGSHVEFSTSLLQHATGGALCTGAGQRVSAGGNLASDGSCGHVAGDGGPTQLQLEETDALSGAPLPVGAAVDLGGDCPAVDLRGAPRPQSPEGAAAPRCDAGAIELGINPYRGLWIPDRSGHGVDIHTAGNQLFLTWYTYHPDGSPAAYQAVAQLTGPVWRAPLTSAQRLPDGSIERFEAGEVEIAFASDTAATLRWRIGEGDQEGEEGLQAYFFAAGEPRFESTGTWYDPTDSGWGLTVTRRGAITGVVLYFYDGDGVLRWAIGQGGDGDVLDLSLNGFTGFCPSCDASANPAVAAPAGSIRMQFLTPRRARAWLDAGTAGQARFQRSDARLVPLSDPVDNRRAAAAAPVAQSPDAAL